MSFVHFKANVFFWAFQPFVTLATIQTLLSAAECLGSQQRTVPVSGATAQHDVSTLGTARYLCQIACFVNTPKHLLRNRNGI